MMTACMEKELQGRRSARRCPRTCVLFEHRYGLLLGCFRAGASGL